MQPYAAVAADTIVRQVQDRYGIDVRAAGVDAETVQAAVAPTTVPATATSEREVLEGEAEHLAHLLSAALLHPAFTVDEDLFG